MSYLIASVLEIQSCESLHIVKFDFNGQSLTMMSLELNEKIQKYVKVKLSIKPTNIAIAKNFSGGLSHANQVKATIKGIENGKLLSSIVLELTKDITLESIITKESAFRLELKIKDEVSVIIKASDISISEIVDA